MIPKESVLRGVIKELNTISNNFIQKAPGNISIKIAISVLEAYLNTPEGWPEKKEYGPRCSMCDSEEGAPYCDSCKIANNGVDFWNKAIDECRKAAMKGCPCCGVARIVEKQAEVPTVEEILHTMKEIWRENEKTETLGDWMRRTAKAVQELIKSKQKEKQAEDNTKPASPEEIIANYEKAKHSADNSTLVFNSKEQAEVPTVQKKKRKIPYPHTSQHATKKFLSS